MGRELKWLRAHVLLCLQDVWEQCRVVTDDDGDAPFRTGTAACWVSVVDGDPLLVRVWAHAAFGLRPTPAVLREINDVNRRSRTAGVFWSDGVVVVQQVLHADGVDKATLGHACNAVSTVANDVGLMLAAVHGGATPYPAEDEPADHRDAG